MESHHARPVSTTRGYTSAGPSPRVFLRIFSTERMAIVGHIPGATEYNTNSRTFVLIRVRASLFTPLQFRTVTAEAGIAAGTLITESPPHRFRRNSRRLVPPRCQNLQTKSHGQGRPVCRWRNAHQLYTLSYRAECWGGSILEWGQARSHNLAGENPVLEGRPVTG